jgi:hypothetical protein
MVAACPSRRNSTIVFAAMFCPCLGEPPLAPWALLYNFFHGREPTLQDSIRGVLEMFLGWLTDYPLFVDVSHFSAQNRLPGL